MRLILLTALAACHHPGPELVVSTSFVLMESSATGPSPLDPINGRTIAFEVVFDHADVAHMAVSGCHDTILTAHLPSTTATGETAPTVTTEILGILPDWDVTLSLCDVPTESSTTLHADNYAGLGVVIGCLDTPASAIQRDGASDPMWSSFTGSRCDATVYDQLHGDLFNGTNFTITFAAGQ